MKATDEQLAALLQFCGDFARQMIQGSGEFYPFGAEIVATGELVVLGFGDGTERPPPQELYEYGQVVLTRKAAAREIIASAIAVNVNVPPQFESPFRDGIRVHVEAVGYSRLIYEPYQIRKSGILGRKRIVEFGELFTVEVDQISFKECLI